MNRREPAAHARDVATTSHAELRVPKQRPRERTVLLVLTSGEPLTQVVEVAAHAAKQQHVPLVIAMLSTSKHVDAPCMAALDSALQLVRAASPSLVVRVYTLAPDEITAHLTPDELVVASPRTWSGLPDRVRAAHPPGAHLQLVEPGDR